MKVKRKKDAKVEDIGAVEIVLEDGFSEEEIQGNVIKTFSFGDDE
ncbi:MAG: hypothetical protein ACRC7N_04425 [Clostridium sp.]